MSQHATKKKLVPSRMAPPVPMTPPVSLNVHLTLHERDKINEVQGRIRRLSALLCAIQIHADSPLEDTGYDEDAEAGLGDLMDQIYRDAVTLDEVLDSADKRLDEEKAGGAQ